MTNNINKSPLITVITVVYNDINNIEKTILSVINQTYSNIEYIVIDGGSIDGTVEVIKKYSKKINYWISEPDKGIYDAMNKGIHKANGEWCCFINAGDLFAGNNVLQSIFTNQNDEYDVIYGDTIHIFPSGKFIRTATKTDELRYHMPFCHQSSFVKTLILKENEFNCQYKIAADYNFFYSLYKNGGKFLYINKTISIFDNIEGISSNNINLFCKEYSRINGKSALISILKIRVRKILKSIITKILPKHIQKYAEKTYKDKLNGYKKLSD